MKNQFYCNPKKLFLFLIITTIVTVVFLIYKPIFIDKRLPTIMEKLASSDIYLVTGGAGFIGSHLIDRLLHLTVTIVLLDDFSDNYDPSIKRHNVAMLQARQSDSTLLIIEGSINDAQLMKKIFTTYTITHVIHLAALPGVRTSIIRASRYMEVNCEGTQLLLAMASLSRQPPLFIFSSTSSVYGQTNKVPFIETDPCNQPLSPYAASKKSAEIIAHVYHHLKSLNVTILRLFNVYGPRGRPDMIPFILMKASLDSSRVVDIYDNGTMQRDWTYVDDVIDAIITALKRPMGYEIINIGYGRPIRLLDMIEQIQQLSGKRIRTQQKSSYETEASITFCSNDKARRLIGFAPKTNISEGLRKTWFWFRQAYADNGR